MNEEIVVNEQGGAQSAVGERCDLFPARAFLLVSEVLAVGTAKYAPNNWRLIPAEGHLNHCLRHMMLYMQGDTSDDHLGHAARRMMMWAEMALIEGRREPTWPVVQAGTVTGREPD